MNDAVRETALKATFVGEGEIAVRMRSLDWSQTSLGAVETWPDSLKAIVQILLAELDHDQQSDSSSLNAKLLPEDASTQAMQDSASRVDASQSHQFALLFTELGDRPSAESFSPQTAEFNAFRIALVDALCPLSDPREIQATACRKLGEYLGANRVAYFGVQGANYVVERDYVDGVETLADQCLVDSLNPTLVAVYRAGLIVSVSDVESDPNLSAEMRSAYAAIQVGAYLGIPLIKKGEFVAGLAVQTVTPRAWAADEILLAEEVAARAWAAIERACVEATLRDSENRLRMAIESTQLGTWDWNLITNQLLWDKCCKAMLGLPPDAESSIEIFFARVHPGDRERLEELVQWVLNPASGGTCNVEYRTVELQDGVERWIAARGQVYFGADQTPQRFVGTVLNITDQKRIEGEREQLLVREQAAREAADRANRIKDEFLAVLSHELRSPLNPILGWSKLLQQGKLDATRTNSALATIERNARLQVQLIDDLLDISRILQGKLTMNTLPVHLSFVISAAVETVRLAIDSKAIQFNLMLDPEVGQVLGDAARLQQVVWNLLSNAAKFTPAGGQITVELTQAGAFAQLQVSDTGKGIHPDFLPYVFEHFRQEDGATTRKFGGLGLGLAIVRQIVELHGGTVAVSSPGEGEGATFTVQIPLASNCYEFSAIAPPANSSKNLRGVHALLVDDDADSRDVLEFILKNAGAVVTTVASAPEAIAALSKTRPSIIISDVGMPGMDGYMLLRRIRGMSVENGSQIPAVALTAYAGEIDQQQAIAAGFQRHIAKPIDPDAIITLITELVFSD